MPDIIPPNGSTPVKTAPVRLTFNLRDSVNVVDGVWYSDPIRFTVTPGVNYIVHVTSSELVGYATLTTQATESYWKQYVEDETMTGSRHSYNASGNMMWIEAIESATPRSAMTSVYYLHAVFSPIGLMRDGQLMIKETSLSALISDGHWYYDAGEGRIYIRSDHDPSKYLFEAIHRDYAIKVQGRAYLEFRNLTTLQAASVDILNSSVTSVNYTDVDASLSAGTGLYYESGSNGGTVTRGVFCDDGLIGGDRNGIAIGGNDPGSSNITIQYSEICRAGLDNVEVATTTTDKPMVNIKLLYNYIHDAAQHGIHIGGGHSDLEVRANLLIHNQANGIIVNDGISGHPSGVGINNTLFQNGTGFAHAVMFSNNAVLASDNFNWRNNIHSGAQNKELVVPLGYEPTFDYNLYYHPGGGRFLTWHGTNYDLAAWKLRSHQDTHSLEADPMFRNSGARDFRLAGGSPAESRGERLDLKYSLALRPTSDFPHGVTTQHSDGWDIGAFVRDSSLRP